MIDDVKLKTNLWNRFYTLPGLLSPATGLGVRVVERSNVNGVHLVVIWCCEGPTVLFSEPS